MGTKPIASSLVTLDAVVFDFDGLILDTEWAIYESAVAAFAAHGHALPVEAWATIIGTNSDADNTWWDQVCAAAGVINFDLREFEAVYAEQDRSSRDRLPALPGIAMPRPAEPLGELRKTDLQRGAQAEVRDVREFEREVGRGAEA